MATTAVRRLISNILTAFRALFPSKPTFMEVSETRWLINANALTAVDLAQGTLPVLRLTRHVEVERSDRLRIEHRGSI